uniref:3-oxoacyl-ACP reductase FabG n=1 Tax=Salinicola salarius TaxID=430457 RepID=UPI0026ED9BD6
MEERHPETILVTGANRGIGEAIARRLARDGHDLVLHCRRPGDDIDAVKAAVEAEGRRARIVHFDVAERETVKAVLEADIAEHGCYYGVVCNAGITADKPFPALTGEDWDGVLRTNLDGFYNVLHPLVMPMIQRRRPGRIVALSSMSGLIGNRGQVNYSAAKAGMLGLTRAVARETATQGVTVNAITPGIIETDLIDGMPDAKREAYEQFIPMRRFGSPEDVA